MPNANTEEDGRPEYTKLTIEVRKDVVERLARSAAKYSRYRTAAHVAAECVHLYLPLLETLDRATRRFQRKQIASELKKARKA